VHSSDPEQAALPGVLDGPKTPTERLSRALDQINTRFGRNTVTLGPRTRGRADNVGAKIAFGRIPEAAEFNE
jgi:DNA polymerase-4